MKIDIATTKCGGGTSYQFRNMYTSAFMGRVGSARATKTTHNRVS